MSSEPTKRKPISQTARFEVFKRDAFTCQYCGKKSPDVILHVDHIRPVADGGENDIMNLITSCAECNGGKGARKLDDSSMLEKQRRQLDELSERHAQLKMMLEWRDGLIGIEDASVAAVQNEFLRWSSWTANETGEKEIRRWLRAYSLAEILSSITTSFDAYFKHGDEKQMSETWEKSFAMIPRIAAMNRRGGLSEPMKQIYYARGILRKRLTYIRERDLIAMMKSAVAAGVDPSDIIGLCKEVRTWREFESTLTEWMKGNSNGQD